MLEFRDYKIRICDIFVVTVIGFTSVDTSLDETTESVTVTLNVTGADLELETIVVSISTHDISATGWFASTH